MGENKEDKPLWEEFITKYCEGRIILDYSRYAFPSFCYKNYTSDNSLELQLIDQIKYLPEKEAFEEFISFYSKKIKPSCENYDNRYSVQFGPISKSYQNLHQFIKELRTSYEESKESGTKVLEKKISNVQEGVSDISKKIDQLNVLLEALNLIESKIYQKLVDNSAETGKLPKQMV